MILLIFVNKYDWFKKLNFMTKPTIRIARSGEEEAIHDAHMRSIREVCSKDHSAAEILVWGNRPLGEKWKEAILSGYVWVVEFEGKICGHGYIRFLEDDSNDRIKRAHILGLYLTPEVLGQGLGKQLGKLMIEAAKYKQVKIITLESTLTAHKFYQQLGFTDTGPKATFEISGQAIQYFPMALRI